MKKWEYSWDSYCDRHHFWTHLLAMGDNGWELIGWAKRTDSKWIEAIFKRPVEEDDIKQAIRDLNETGVAFTNRCMSAEEIKQVCDEYQRDIGEPHTLDLGERADALKVAEEDDIDQLAETLEANGYPGVVQIPPADARWGEVKHTEVLDAYCGSSADPSTCPRPNCRDCDGRHHADCFNIPYDERKCHYCNPCPLPPETPCPPQYEGARKT